MGDEDHRKRLRRVRKRAESKQWRDKNKFREYLAISCYTNKIDDSDDEIIN